MRRVRKNVGKIVAADDILRAEPRAVELLAASDRTTWQCLVRFVAPSDECTLVLVRALLAIDDPQGWRGRIYHAFVGLNPDDGMEADYIFGRWFAAGIVRHLPKTDPAALGLRYRSALDDIGPDTAKCTRELTVEIEQAGDSAQHRSLLGRALLLLARRDGEEGDDANAIAMAQRAEGIFMELGDSAWCAQAMRVQAGALLRLKKIDEALALIDTLFAAPFAWFTIEGLYRLTTSSDPIVVALSDAARRLLSASKHAPEWIHALGAIAERTGHRGCAERFEAGQRILAEQERERAQARAHDEVDIWNQKGRII